MPSTTQTITAGQLIAQHRQELGLSIEELALRLELTPSMLKLLEQGRGRVPLSRVFDFAAVLGLDEAEMLEAVLRSHADLQPLHRWLFGPGGKLRH